MDKKALTIGVLALTLLIGAGVVFTASAYRGSDNQLGVGKNFERNGYQNDNYGQGNRQGRGMMNGDQRGQNRGGNFIDRNGNGVCDHME